VQRRIDIAADLISEYGTSEEIERMRGWTVKYVDSISTDADGYTLAETDYAKQETVFYRTMLENPSGVDTVLHEFRHLFPENYSLIRRSDWLKPWEERAVEMDAIKWVDGFRSRRGK